MKDSIYTPGPWEHRAGSILGPWETHPVKSGQPFVASIGFPSGHCYTERQLANAKLISSAPELLEALEALLHGSRKVTSQADWNAEREEASAKARAAIAKAKGHA